MRKREEKGMKNHDEYRKALQLTIDCNNYLAAIFEWLNRNPSTARDVTLHANAKCLHEDTETLYELLCAD